jgi:hypothetical protein
VFTSREWLREREGICRRIREKYLGTSKIVVRSSALCEDGSGASQAGRFRSVLDVNVCDRAISSAVDAVVESYTKDNRTSSGDDQILVQSQTENIRISGVVFTRQIETNAPYYVVNYDESSGKTDTVTGGFAGSTVYISHYLDITPDHRWYGLIQAVKEIESLFPGMVLDIEFAVTRRGDVVIFQVRPLAANKCITLPDDDFVRRLIGDMVGKFRGMSGRVPHLGGKTTVLGDMPDWNPAEIIGSRPNTLDYSIYGFIVTDEVWHQARTSLGYYDVYPAELMVSFARKPFIDTRASFNSLTPADISSELREKIVNFYLNKLRDNPACQDKVEFEILWTCYDFNTRDELEVLLEHGFTEAEVSELGRALYNLTNEILKNSDIISMQDLEQVRYLAGRRDLLLGSYDRHDATPWKALSAAYNILQNCKRFGTFPFSRQARLAFIAKSFLISMRKQGVISEQFYHEFLNSIRTVASQLNDDYYQMQNGKMDKETFFQRYGHLRAGTYDITAPRYDRSPELFCRHDSLPAVKRTQPGFSIAHSCINDIGKLLRSHHLPGDGHYLINFIRSSIENREYAKFEFTRSLSDALELITMAGQMLGFGREELCHADLPTLMKFRNPEHGDPEYAKMIIGQSIERHRTEREWYGAVILPPVISSEDDFYCVPPYGAKPNFITRNVVQGEVVNICKLKCSAIPELKNKIVLLENADPGYDWIFMKQPLGIITKYGGVASHMSIRCAEFGTSAAIGCGDVIYELMTRTKSVLLDCEKGVIKPLVQF